MGTRAPVVEPRSTGDLLEQVESALATDRDREGGDQRGITEAAALVSASLARLETALRAHLEATAELAAARAEWDARVAAFRTLHGTSDGAPDDASPPAGGRARRPRRPARAPVPVGPGRERAEPLAISTFGRFEVRRGGERVRLCSSRSGQLILRYLASHPHHRESSDALMELIWPEDAPKVARHKLHCAFSALRTSLQAGSSPSRTPYLRFVDGFYELTPDVATTVDVDAVLRAWRTGQRLPPSEAAALYESACAMASGTFLPDDIYADWALARRERVAGAIRSMQHALAAHRLAEGRPDAAREWCQRLLAENRADEGAYLLLMQVEVAGGRRAEAIRHYQACRGVLRDELGIEPMPETTAYFEAIVRGEAGS